MAGCGVPANHLPRWVPLHALLARGSVDGATNLCSPSTLLKVNYQVMRYLYFVSVEGDLQEGHFTLPNANSPSARAQKFRFCAREARKWGVQRAKAHKNLDFVLVKPENGGSEGKKRTKTSILCSKCPKTVVPDPKSAQKPRFCARNARKLGFWRAKAHKNLDFVLGKPENLTSGLVLVLLLMLIIDKFDVAIFCIDWIYNNNYFILHCQR